jgi:hypothetical protein
VLALGVATAALSLLAAGCGGGGSVGVAGVASSATTATTTTQNGPVAFSSCMRSNGVPNWPDPDSSGRTPKSRLEHLGVSDSRLQAARSACRHLLPNGGRPPNQAQLQQIGAQALRFSRCVRSHGVPNFPDPGSDGRIPDPATAGVDQGSPKFQAANQACGKYRPPYVPSNSAYNSWARTHTGSGS